mgnify:CR=1 FL=1
MSKLKEAVCVLTQGNIKGFILFSEKQNTNFPSYYFDIWVFSQVMLTNLVC